MAENNENSYIARIPPHDNDAEQMVLSCMMYPDDDGVRIAAEHLVADDFYSPANRLIFNAFIDLYNNNVPIDFITAKNKISSLGILEQVGGAEYLVSLSSLAPTTAKTRFYADIVKQKAIYRKLIKISDNIASASYEGSEDAETLIYDAEQKIMEVSQNVNKC